MTTPRLLPPHYFLASVVLIAGLALPTNSALFPGWVQWLAIVPMLAGLGIAVRASRQFSAADTNIVPFSESTALVTDGTFAFSRNPMYLGMMLFLTGAAAATNEPLPWLVVALFFLVIHFRFILNEEKHMTAAFGDVYRRYARTVRRWL